MKNPNRVYSVHYFWKTCVNDSKSKHFARRRREEEHEGKVKPKKTEMMLRNKKKKMGSK